MDSDEELMDTDILRRRYEALTHFPKVKCMHMGYATPHKSRPCCYYINTVGDPFTCFIYQSFLGGMEGMICRRGIYNEEYGCYLAHYEADDIKPIGDGAAVMDLDYLRSHYGQELEDTTTCALFEKMLADTGWVVQLKGDRLRHYTEASFGTFLRKIKFRIINNIFHVEGSGYADKSRGNKRMARRKYLYPFYTVSVVLPLYDGIRMSVYYRHWVFALHPLFCFYVLGEVAWQYGCKLLKIHHKNESYAKQKREDER